MKLASRFRVAITDFPLKNNGVLRASMRKERTAWACIRSCLVKKEDKSKDNQTQNSKQPSFASAAKDTHVLFRAVTKEDLGVQVIQPVRASITLKRSFSDSQLKMLHMGHIGSITGNNWSWLMEGDLLFICLCLPINVIFIASACRCKTITTEWQLFGL